jgi:hypothetical protein
VGQFLFGKNRGWPSAADGRNQQSEGAATNAANEIEGTARECREWARFSLNAMNHPKEDERTKTSE